MNSDTKTRVMFVDDEANVLKWLERELNPMSNTWEMAFVESGARALELMEQSPFHVIVSDMRMPQMTGAELLVRLKQNYPRSVRLIISDYADRNSIVECAGTAHQFLSKPCHPDELRTAINRACSFNSCEKSDRIKKLISQLDFLPSIPSILQELLQELQKSDPCVERIGTIIGRDMAMTAKILRIVNSGFFGLNTEISNPTEAVSYLGLSTIKGLTLTTQAFTTFEKKNTGPISLDSLWRHCLQVAGLARAVANDVAPKTPVVEESFLAGMLHDIGKLALAVNLPDKYPSVVASAQYFGISLQTAEEAAFGAHHGDVGGYLLNLWGLPPRVVNGIIFHHEPQLEGADEFTPAAAVYIANTLTLDAATPGIDTLNHKFLDKLGIDEFVPRWKTMATA